MVFRSHDHHFWLSVSDLAVVIYLNCEIASETSMAMITYVLYKDYLSVMLAYMASSISRSTMDMKRRPRDCFEVQIEALKGMIQACKRIRESNETVHQN